MATPDDLATRVLKKLQILGLGQTASPEDSQAALEKIQAVHASVSKDERVRWTLQRVPQAAEEPYVLMAAFLLSPEYPQAVDASSFWAWGQRELNSLINVKRTDAPVRTEYF